jgi:hypothetical protein
MKLIAKYNKQIFEIIEDLPEVGFYIYVYDSDGNNTHDYLQVDLESAKRFALEAFAVPLEAWEEESS